MGTILIVIGIAILISAGIGYVLTNPRVISGLRESLQTARRSANDARQLAQDVQGATERVSQDTPVDEQFADLRLNETAELNPDGRNILERKESAVTCRGLLQALNRTGRDFTDRGEPWRLFVLDGDTMLFRRPDGWFWFEMGKAKVLDGESAREFDSAGETFSAKGQRPRCHTFSWRGKRLTILDVGYLRFEREEGTCHLSHGEMIKYMLAEDANGNVYYLENLKVGTDRIWTGGIALGMSIKPYVGKILRAA